MIQKYLKIRTYLTIGFGLVIIFTLLIGIVGIKEVNHLSDLTLRMYTHPFAVSNAVKNVKTNVIAMHRSMKDIALAKNETELNLAIENINKFQTEVHENFDIIHTKFLGEQGDILAAERAFYEWNDIRKEVIALAKKGEKDQALEVTKEKSSKLIKELEIKVNVMVDFAQNKAKSFLNDAINEKNDVLAQMIFLLLIALLLGVFISTMIARSVAIPLMLVVSWLKDIEKNNFEKEPTQIDKKVKEIKDLIKTINSLSEILKQNEAYNRGQNWLKAGVMKLGKQFSNISQKTLPAISDEALEVLCRHANASVGALYIVCDHDESLLLTGSYALTAKKSSEKYILGEGIVGQVGRNKKAILLNNIQENQFLIESSVSENIIPSSIYTFPLIYENRVKGVVQLGSHNAFDPIVLEFLNMAAEDLSAYICAAMQQEQIAKLLKETQQKNEELQMQSEEMQVQAEELETQSEALHESYITLEERQKQLEKATEEANQANQYKSEFLANMSHEIRTPMNAVLGFSDLLSRSITDKKQKSYLDSIKVAGKTLLSLINDVLDLSKIEAGLMELHYDPVNIEDIFEELQQIFTFKADEKSIDFTMEIAENLPSNLMLDEVRFRQIMLNLIGNALKFTEDGYVKLSVLCGEMGHGRVDLRIFVEDTGIGIHEDQQEVIFESFKQQAGQDDKQYGGTGLGLTITKRLIEKMHGSITVKSVVGKGSIFEVFLPKVRISNEKSEKIKKINEIIFNATNIDFEPATVLIVDDVESNRHLIKENFLHTAISLLEAKNGQEGIEFAEKHEPDVILMDIKMPVMDGHQAAQHIKSQDSTKDIPIIALTASSTLAEQEKVKNAAYFDEVLIKPVDVNELFEKLSHYLNYTQKAKVELKTTEEKSLLTEEEVAKLPELLDILERKMLLESREIVAMMEIDEIENFAKRIVELGKFYNVTLLTNYGENLVELTESFEIEDIEKMLKKFHKIVKKIKILAEKQSKKI